ncbi:MAG TPA: CDP-alcohol phosphatidyltransferase family protein [Candidatus Limnocylindrales bacterium]|nr:CDP-alcohol phosphatidyltransferase family protein [Candidatus Limnocylindrales bacterium]
MKLLDPIRDIVKSVMRSFARLLNHFSGGKLTPNQVTIAGLLAHLPIVWLIATRHNVVAAILLIIFGLFDTLDGELARLQKWTTPLGMFMDSSTDRMKEILLYCGIVAALLQANHKVVIVAAVGALGASLCTSYLNAWGEAVLATVQSSKAHAVNKSFRSGLLSFELRMVLIIGGLLFNRLDVVVYIIVVLATITVMQRFMHITGRLKNV